MTVEATLVAIATQLAARQVLFALVGGLAISIRAIVAAPVTSGAPSSVPVATAEDLLAMKILSMRSSRLQDTIDACNLVAIAEPVLDRVRELLELIEARGYARGQDLRRKLEEFLLESP